MASGVDTEFPCRVGNVDRGLIDATLFAATVSDSQNSCRKSGLSVWKSQLELAIASYFPSHTEIALWHCRASIASEIAPSLVSVMAIANR